MEKQIRAQIMKRDTKIRITIIAIGLIVVAGCQNTHKQKKQEMRAKWQQTTSEIKLSAAMEQFEAGQYEQAKAVAQQCIDSGLNLPDAHLLYGKLLLVEDKGTDAERELRLAVELDEELGEGWYWLGVAAEGRGNYQQAQACYDRAMSLRPENIDYILAAAEVYSVQDRKDDAVRLLEEKIAQMPKAISLKVACADFLWQMGNDQQAIEYYKQAMLMAGNDYSEDIAESLGYCYIFAGRWDEAAKIFTELSVRCTQQKKNLYLQVAALCGMNSGGYGTAVNYYDRLTVTERDNPQVWLKLGQAALGAGAADRAFECGRKVLSLQPGSAEAIALIGCAQYVSGNYTVAITEFEKIATDDKYGAFSWLMRARCYGRLGKVVKAKLAYKKALEMNPNSELGKFLARDMEEASLLLEGATRLTN